MGSISLQQKWKMDLKLLLPCLLLVWLVLPADGLKIGAFNIQAFGMRKARKNDVMDKIVRIIRRYDIMFMQEIRDSSGLAMEALMHRLRRQGGGYNLAQSCRLGRTRSKEQYAYIYRNNMGVTLLETYQSPDPEDDFEREPFSAWFRINSAEIRDLVLVGVHVAPGDAQAEINQLDEVRADVIRHWGIQDVIIMGDMNADCRYLSQRRQNNLDLRKDGGVSYWLIPDNADTTVARNKCAYDRFIASGPHMPGAIVHGSAKAFTFDKAYNLTYRQARQISDHYPIELELKEKQRRN